MNYVKRHQDLLHNVLKVVSKEFGLEVVIFKRVTGLFKRGSDGGYISTGSEGLCDLYGYLANSPKGAIPFEIEIKTGNAVLSKVQSKWKMKCNKMNIKHIVVRDNEESRLIREMYEWKKT